jgi:hypothetical protein
MSIDCAVAQKFPCFIYWKLAEGTRLETPQASGAMGPELTVSFRSQSLAEELAAAEELVTPDRIRWFCHSSVSVGETMFRKTVWLPLDVEYEFFESGSSLGLQRRRFEVCA